MHVTAITCWRKLQAAGLDIEVRELGLAGAAPTAAERAAAVGCAPGQVADAVLWVVKAKPLLVLHAGDRRVVAELLGEGAAPARPDQVRGATGYGIGGVPPLGHLRPLPTVVDESLTRFETVWCTAGLPGAVFEVGLAALLAALPGAELRAVSVPA